MPELDYRNLPRPVLDRLVDAYGADLVAARRQPGLHITYKGRKLEQRVHRGVELRKSENDEPIIDGYATVYDHPYDVMGGPDLGGWTETVALGATARSIANQDDVFMFFDHEGLPLASTKAGTLTLESDKLGLRNEARIDPRSQWSMEIVHRLERGELDSESFAFQVLADQWNADYTERLISEVKLFDTSVVSFPANPATVAQLRADVVNIVEKKSGMPLSLALALADQARCA
jgi:HK97 family phage prohead protease